MTAQAGLATLVGAGLAAADAFFLVEARLGGLGYVQANPSLYLRASASLTGSGALAFPRPAAWHTLFLGLHLGL